MFFDKGQKDDDLFALASGAGIMAIIFFSLSLGGNFSPKFMNAAISLFIITNSFSYKPPEHTILARGAAKLYLYLTKSLNLAMIIILALLGLEIEKIIMHPAYTSIAGNLTFINAVWIAYVIMLIVNFIYIFGIYCNKYVPGGKAVILNEKFIDEDESYKEFPFITYQKDILQKENSKFGRYPLLEIPSNLNLHPNRLEFTKENPETGKKFDFHLEPKLMVKFFFKDKAELHKLRKEAKAQLMGWIDVKFEELGFKDAINFVLHPDGLELWNKIPMVVWIGSRLSYEEAEEEKK